MHRYGIDYEKDKPIFHGFTEISSDVQDRITVSWMSEMPVTKVIKTDGDRSRLVTGNTKKMKYIS